MLEPVTGNTGWRRIQFTRVEREKKTAAYKLGNVQKLRLNLTSEGPEEAAKIKKVRIKQTLFLYIYIFEPPQSKEKTIRTQTSLPKISRLFPQKSAANKTFLMKHCNVNPELHFVYFFTPTWARLDQRRFLGSSPDVLKGHSLKRLLVFLNVFQPAAKEQNGFFCPVIHRHLQFRDESSLKLLFAH